eukprot:scaffold155823_cov21-Tisochrysis_lutea.AAC.1
MHPPERVAVGVRVPLCTREQAQAVRSPLPQLSLTSLTATLAAALSSKAATSAPATASTTASTTAAAAAAAGWGSHNGSHGQRAQQGGDQAQQGDTHRPYRATENRGGLLSGPKSVQQWGGQCAQQGKTHRPSRTDCQNGSVSRQECVQQCGGQCTQLNGEQVQQGDTHRLQSRTDKTVQQVIQGQNRESKWVGCFKDVYLWVEHGRGSMHSRVVQEQAQQGEPSMSSSVRKSIGQPARLKLESNRPSQAHLRRESSLFLFSLKLEQWARFYAP